MLEQIFSVYDVKAKSYSPPIFLVHIGEASRVFSDAINKEGHLYNLHPEDYTLYHLGQFDNNSGKITDIDPKLIYSGQQLINLDKGMSDEIQLSPQPDEPPILTST